MTRERFTLGRGREIQLLYTRVHKDGIRLSEFVVVPEIFRDVRRESGSRETPRVRKYRCAARCHANTADEARRQRARRRERNNINNLYTLGSVRTYGFLRARAWADVNRTRARRHKSPCGSKRVRTDFVL